MDYLASENSKSAGYVRPDYKSRTGIMFLVEGAMGNMHKIYRDDSSLVKAPKGFDSVLAVGSRLRPHTCTVSDASVAHSSTASAGAQAVVPEWPQPQIPTTSGAAYDSVADAPVADAAGAYCTPAAAAAATSSAAATAGSSPAPPPPRSWQRSCSCALAPPPLVAPCAAPVQAT